MSTNKILTILGAIIIVLSVAIAAALSVPGYEDAERQQIHENALTLRAAINASAVSSLLASGPSVNIVYGTDATIHSAQLPTEPKSVLPVIIGAWVILGVVGATVVAGAYLLLINRKTIAAQLSSFAATPQSVPVENGKQ